MKIDRDTIRLALLRLFWEINHPSVGGASVMAAVHGYAPLENSEKVIPILEREEVVEAFRLCGLDLPTMEVPDYPKPEYGVFNFDTRTRSSRGVTIVEDVWDTETKQPLFRGTATEVKSYIEEHKDEYEGGLTRVFLGLKDRGEEEAFFSKYTNARSN
tara:strand:+ start:2165 stop:2638 length:474 start_codon:yes stop_codon:yes gene_type:complete